MLAAGSRGPPGERTYNDGTSCENVSRISHDVSPLTLYYNLIFVTWCNCRGFGSFATFDEESDEGEKTKHPSPKTKPA